jgi:hypothetical protein
VPFYHKSSRRSSLCFRLDRRSAALHTVNVKNFISFLRIDGGAGIKEKVNSQQTETGFLEETRFLGSAIWPQLYYRRNPVSGQMPN